jgi:hypothetical protein
MSRSGLLLLGVLVVFACKHAQEVDTQGDEAIAREDAAAKKDSGEPKAKARSGDADAKKEQASRPAARTGARQGDKKAQARRPAYEGRPELSSTPAGLMKEDGPEKLQRALAKRGYYTGQVSGKLDERTAEALMRFQADERLARTGAPDRETCERLGLSFEEIYRTPKNSPRAPEKPDSDPSSVPNT